MAARKWYQDPKIAVPVLVAMIGLAGTFITVAPWKDKPGKPTEPTEPNTEKDPAPLATVTPTAVSVEPAATPVPTPEPVVSFPVVVIDDATGDHIAGVQIVADEQGVSTETDSQGRCTLSVRPGQGKIRVTVSRSGYRSRNVELTVFEGMDPARIRLQRS